MKLAAIKTNDQNWNDIKIAIGGDQPTIIVLKDSDEVEGLHFTLMTALFDTPDVALTLTLGDNEYTLEVPVWTELLDNVAQWMEEFLPATDPDFCTSEIDLASFGKRDLSAPGSDTTAQVIEFAHFQ